MSVESLTVALHHSRAKGTARLVLLGIANHDGDGGAWPSIATLAKYAGNVHPRNVQRAISTLVELGEVDVELQAGGTAETPDVFRPNRYRVTLSCPSDCDRSPQHRTARQLRLVGRDPLAPAPPPGASATPPPGASATPPPGASATRTVLTNHPVNTGAVTDVTNRARRRAVDKPAHDCHRGWLGEDDEGRRRPCLICKPHLADRRHA